MNYPRVPNASHQPLFDQVLLFWEGVQTRTPYYYHGGRMAMILERGFGLRGLDSPCPNDTNGDGDCGRRYCPYCGIRRK